MKPCVNCPDEGNYLEVEARGEKVKLALPPAYSTSRPYAHHLQNMQLTLPAYWGERQFQRPVFHQDGSIEYPRLGGDESPPDEIDGYHRDPDNAWKFFPDWQPCLLRGQGAAVKASGCIDTKMACQNPEAEQWMKPVKHEHCSACPVRKQ